MSNEIQSNSTLAISKGGMVVTKPLGSMLDMSGDNIIDESVLASASSSAALDFGPITGVPKKVALLNFDAAHFVTLALDSGMTQAFAKILPGDYILFTPPTATIYIKADTADCKCELVAAQA